MLTVPTSIVGLVGTVMSSLLLSAGAWVRWCMRQNEKLHDELTTAYKTTLPVMEQSLASQREMVELTRQLTQVMAVERSRRPDR